MEFLGALKAKTDVRDYKLKVASGYEYPETYMIPFLPDVKNQRSVNSCVAHATAAILEALNHNETHQYKQLSTDFIYGMQGVAYGRKEPGMYLRDACKIVKDYGDPLKTTISTNIEQPKCTDKLQEILTDDIYQEAAIHRVESYAQCNNTNAIKHALMNYGPVLISLQWHNKRTIGEHNILHMDRKSDYGYHAVMIYGWNKYGWLIQNSWGASWNGNGRFVWDFNEPIEEAWSFVDAENSDVYKPKRGSIIDFIYKFINFIVNLLKGKR